MNTLNNFDTFYFLGFSPAHDAPKMRGSLGVSPCELQDARRANGLVYRYRELELGVGT